MPKRTYFDKIDNPNGNLLFTAEQLNACGVSESVLPVRCLNCGKIFYINHKQYTEFLRDPINNALKFCCFKCSVEYRRNRSTSVTKPCLVCGKPVTKGRSEAERLPNFFCCRSHATTYNNTHRVRKPKPLKLEKPKPIRYCHVCGKPKSQCDNPLHTSGFFKKSSHQTETLLVLVGFDRSTLGTPLVDQEIDRIRSMLYDMHWNQKMSCQSILRHFNIDIKKCHEISVLFERLGIPKRPMQDISHYSALNSTKVAVRRSTNGYRTYKSGHHTTWDNNTVFYRSSYELDYCLQLDRQQIRYQMEAIRIEYFDSQKNQLRVAVPDFYLPDCNMIVEVKSLYTYDYQNMIDKVVKYRELGYNFMLILDHQYYYECPNVQRKLTKSKV